MPPIRIGFIGLSSAGWASTSLFPPLLKSPLVEKYSLTAVSTSSPLSASKSANKYTEITGHTVKGYHGDTAQISNDTEVDLVAISVKAPDHKQATLAVIEAGKDFFIEWPLGNGLAEALELTAAAKKKGVRAIVGLQARQSPSLNTVKALISSGKIGRVVASTTMGHVSFWGKTVEERSIYLADAKNGAGVLEIAIGHFTDLFTWVLDDSFASITAVSQNLNPEASVVDASGKSTGRTIPRTAANQFAFSGLLTSGTIFSIHWGGSLEPIKGREVFFWQIEGEEGVIRIESSFAMLALVEPTVYLNGEKVNTSEEADNLGNTGRAWLEFAKGEQGNYATIEDAVKNHRVIDAIDRSIKEGRRIDLE